MGISWPRIFARKKPEFSRAATRYSCQLEGSLVVLDKMITFEGRVTDISAGGALFRPKLAYLMSRREVPVCVMLGDQEIYGRIANTSPAGFGLRFDEPVEEATLLRLLEQDSKSFCTVQAA